MKRQFQLNPILRFILSGMGYRQTDKADRAIRIVDFLQKTLRHGQYPLQGGQTLGDRDATGL